MPAANDNRSLMDDLPGALGELAAIAAYAERQESAAKQAGDTRAASQWRIVIDECDHHWAELLRHGFIACKR